MSTFKAKRGKDDITFQFETNDNVPAKLGDGTFGCVFHVRDTQSSNFAVKIFYDTNGAELTKQMKERIEESQAAEMSIGHDLREHYADDIAKSASISRYLVVPYAFVDNFTQSKAYTEFQTFFQDLSYRLSDKAIVMNYYPMSLKDLLEKGWPTEHSSVSGSAPEQLNESVDTADSIQEEHGAESVEDAPLGRGGGGTFGDRSGYAALESLTQSNREISTLPILKDIAEALALLHGPSRRHQDIKPANVLIRTVGPNIEAAIADLGFLDVGNAQVHGSQYQQRPAGTRHYRSPEQTDYFDICEVDINEAEGGNYLLSTTDPKFLDTFSEKGDFVIFAKLKPEIQWEIIDIRFPPAATDSSSDPAKEIEIIIRGLDNLKLCSDERTQITIVKRQTVRTDIFGIGAIAYDMLTCGKSPERFYDLLRARDISTTSIEKDLMLRYSNYKSGGGAVIEIDNIFQHLRIDANSDYPSVKMVSFILKAMMSRADDSYFNRGKEAPAHVWDAIRKDLEEMQIDGKGYRSITANYLTNGGRDEWRPPSLSPIQIELAAIQGISYDNGTDATMRLVKGVRFFDKLGSMIAGLVGAGNDSHYLVDVSPAALQKDGFEHFSSRITFFETERDFQDILNSGNPQTILQGLAAGSLLPPLVHGLVRQGEVWLRDSKDTDSRSFWYDLWGSDYGLGGLNPGDRMLFDYSAEARKNLTIDYENNGHIRFNSNAFGDEIDLDSSRRYRVSFFRKFDPVDYYIAMLGVYLRLIFFVDARSRRQFTPQAIYAIEHIRSRAPNRQFEPSNHFTRHMASIAKNVWSVVNVDKPFRKAKTRFFDRRRDKNGISLAGLFDELTLFYLCLLTRNTANLAGDAHDDHGAVVNINRLVRFVVRIIASQLELDADHLTGDPEDAILAKLEGKAIPLEQFPDIDSLSWSVARKVLRD